MVDIAAAQSGSLAVTGERTVPGIAQENYWFRRHVAAYHSLAPYCADADVLEAGCGEGYGANLIAALAHRVLALDYDGATAAHVRRRYPVLHIAQANLVALPLAEASVDVVVSLQVIEHLWEQDRFLAECARVLRPGGSLLLSTPNRLTFSPGRETPRNPFHTRELAPDELAELVREAGFNVQAMLGLRHGPRLAGLDAAHGGSLIEAQVGAILAGSGWPAGLLSDVAAVRAEDFEINADALDTSLDLIAVARL